MFQFLDFFNFWPPSVQLQSSKSFSLLYNLGSRTLLSMEICYIELQKIKGIITQLSDLNSVRFAKPTKKQIVTKFY